MATTQAALAKAYETAYRTILERIHKRAARGLSTNFQQALLRDIRSILGELDQEALQFLEATVPKQYQQGMTATLRQLQQANPTLAAQVQLTGVHERAVEVLVRNAMGDIAASNASVGRRIEDLLRRKTLDATALKTSTGMTVRETAQSLAKSIVEEGIAPPRGMRPDAYASMVARTTTREASNLGRINQSSELGYDLVQMTDHASPCPVCSQYEGRIYSVSGNSREYPSLYSTAFRSGYNNIHPNCRHTIVPYIPDLADDEAADRQFSNRPFEDTRSEREKRAYQREQERKRQQRATREQWERYRATFGDGNVPGLASFASMKARNSEGYRELMADYRRIARA